MESSFWEFILDLVEKRLVSRITPPESVEADTLSGEVDLCAYQAMGPVGVHGKLVAQDSCLALGIGATEEDDAPFGHRLEVEFPVGGEGAPRGSVFDSGGSTAATGGDELRRSRLQSVTRGMGEAGPDLGLPTAVEVLNGRLEARLAEQPNDAKGWALLAQSYAFMGNRDAAETAVQRAVELGVEEQTLRDRVMVATRDQHPTDWVQQMIGVNRK